MYKYYQVDWSKVLLIWKPKKECLWKGEILGKIIIWVIWDNNTNKKEKKKFCISWLLAKVGFSKKKKKEAKY